MTSQLEQAFAEAGKLPASEQDALAVWLLEELARDRQWSHTLAESANRLSQLADEALAEHHAGHTRPLDPTAL
jgi:hypothetical protein